MDGARQAPELAPQIAAVHADPIIALSIGRGRRAEYAVTDRFARTCAFPGSAVWLFEIEHAKGDVPNAIALWRSPDTRGAWETRCACVWTERRRDPDVRITVIGARWGPNGTRAQGAACVLGPAEPPNSKEARRGRQRIDRRRAAIGPQALAAIAAPAALAWLDAHNGRIQAGGKIGAPPQGNDRIVRPVPAPAREAPPAWLGSRPERAAEALVLRAAGEGWRVGGSCLVRAWRDGWAGRAELGALAWHVLEDPNTAVDQEGWRALERSAAGGALSGQRRYPALAALGALVRKMLVQTGRAHVAPAPDERTLCAIEIPGRLWHMLAAAGPCPEPAPALDLRDGWWLVEIERPGAEEPNAIAVWEEAGCRRTLAAFLGTSGRNEAALSVLSWRTTPEGGHVDAGVAILDYPIRVDDPHKQEGSAGLMTVIEALATPETGAIARVETAVALHLAHGGAATPLGPYRASVARGHARSIPAGRGRAGPDRLFALERAPEPEHRPVAGPGKGRRKARAGTALESLQTVGPHWKRQAHGPKRSKRRWIVIDEYERGPKAEADQIVMTRLAERQQAARAR